MPTVALMDTLYLLAWVSGFVVLLSAFYHRPGRKLSHIPAIGFGSHFLSYLSSLEFYLNHENMLQRGCDKHPNGIFKIPAFGRWRIIISKPKFVEEMRNASDKDMLSFRDAINESLQVSYTLGENIAKDSYHTSVIRTLFPRNVPILFPDVYEEIVAAFSDVIPASPNKREWVKAKPMDIVLPIVARASNRVFVGQPLCRDSEFLDLTIKYAVTVVTSAVILTLVPPFLRPLVGRMLRNVTASVDKALIHLKPIVEERLQNISEHGADYPGKPNDMLSWLMDRATGEERTPRNFASRILIVNFAAIYTTSMTFTQVLLYLAAYPEYAEPMREELQEVLDREGWTHSALGQMTMIDSFIKETMRLSLPVSILERTCRTPFQFSDGTFIPKGAVLATALNALHFDEEIYEDPSTFRPFRFADMANERNLGRKFDIVSTSTNFAIFGHGRKACPGRFFASTVLKTMLAHTLMTYDLKLEDGSSGRPKDMWFLITRLPNQKAHILFRKRAE